MARFVFELEAVLKHRLGEERRRQIVVAQIERERVALEGQVRSAGEGMAREKRELRDRLGAGTSGSLLDVRLQAAAALRLDREARHAVVRLAGVGHRLEAARRALIEATTRRRALEVLKQRRYEAWLGERKRREAGELDELAVMRAPRGGGDDGEVA